MDALKLRPKAGDSFVPWGEWQVPLVSGNYNNIQGIADAQLNVMDARNLLKRMTNQRVLAN